MRRRSSLADVGHAAVFRKGIVMVWVVIASLGSPSAINLTSQTKSGAAGKMTQGNEGLNRGRRTAPSVCSTSQNT